MGMDLKRVKPMAEIGWNETTAYHIFLYQIDVDGLLSGVPDKAVAVIKAHEWVAKIATRRHLNAMRGQVASFFVWGSCSGSVHLVRK